MKSNTEWGGKQCSWLLLVAVGVDRCSSYCKSTDLDGGLLFSSRDEVGWLFVTDIFSREDAKIIYFTIIELYFEIKPDEEGLEPPLLLVTTVGSTCFPTRDAG